MTTGQGEWKFRIHTSCRPGEEWDPLDYSCPRHATWVAPPRPKSGYETSDDNDGDRDWSCIYQNRTYQSIKSSFSSYLRIFHWSKFHWNISFDIVWSFVIVFLIMSATSSTRTFGMISFVLKTSKVTLNYVCWIWKISHSCKSCISIKKKLAFIKFRGFWSKLYWTETDEVKTSKNSNNPFANNADRQKSSVSPVINKKFYEYFSNGCSEFWSHKKL